ncbi:MAG TPA: hydrogenase maturation protease [Thermomicrobiales bacterium]|nr:hydrogenase maturation protease [Thermomicrobiales bacterium]
MAGRVLIAGIGNIFLGDDAFGVEVARRLAARPLPPGVRVEDFGIRGFDLAYALLDGDATILVDALPRGGAPGTLYVLEPEHEGAAGPVAPALAAHGITPAAVLGLVAALGGRPGPLYVVGCEPADLGDEAAGGAMGLSAPVAGAVEGAVELVLSLVGDLLAGDGAAASRHEQREVRR